MGAMGGWWLCTGGLYAGRGGLRGRCGSLGGWLWISAGLGSALAWTCAPVPVTVSEGFAGVSSTGCALLARRAAACCAAVRASSSFCRAASRVSAPVSISGCKRLHAQTQDVSRLKHTARSSCTAQHRHKVHSCLDQQFLRDIVSR